MPLLSGPARGRWLTSALCALALAACGSESSGSAPREPAGLTIVAGDNQALAAGATLEALAVRVVDEGGRPLAARRVTFRVVSGGGSVQAGAVETSADGVATERWTLGTVAADSQRVEASVGQEGSARRLAVTFRAFAQAGAPSAVVVVGAAERTGVVGTALADSLAVRVTDRFGNPLGLAEVRWAAADGDGTTSPTQSFTRTDGVARTVWTLGTVARPQAASATVAGLLPASFTADAQPGPPVVFAGLDGRTRIGVAGATLADSLAVEVKDRFGNLLRGVPVSWAVTFGGGTVSPALSQTGTDGVARTAWTLGGVGSQIATGAAAGFRVNFSAEARAQRSVSPGGTGGAARTP